MSDLAQIISAAFVNQFREHAAHLHQWTDSLSDEQFWRNPFAFGNSIGHLVLHLTGNLGYYVGTRIAETGYVRNRDLEFTDSRRPAKSEVLRKFDDTIVMVISTIERQTEAAWTFPYSAEGEPNARNHFTAVLHCASHLYHHIGQINYLSRELTK